MTDKWQTPFDRGMMCGTCRHWTRHGGGKGTCAVVTHRTENTGKDFPVPFMDTDDIDARFVTEAVFSCPYWSGTPVPPPVATPGTTSAQVSASFDAYLRALEPVRK